MWDLNQLIWRCQDTEQGIQSEISMTFKCEVRVQKLIINSMMLKLMVG